MCTRLRRSSHFKNGEIVIQTMKESITTSYMCTVCWSCSEHHSCKLHWHTSMTIDHTRSTRQNIEQSKQHKRASTHKTAYYCIIATIASWDLIDIKVATSRHLALKYMYSSCMYTWCIKHKFGHWDSSDHCWWTCVKCVLLITFELQTFHMLRRTENCRPHNRKLT